MPAYAGLPGLYRCLAVVRTIDSDQTSAFVHLLWRDEELLRSADPVSTRHGWLPADPELR